MIQSKINHKNKNPKILTITEIKNIEFNYI